MYAHIYYHYYMYNYIYMYSLLVHLPIQQESDDDGEAGAGKRLLELLMNRNDNGVLVMAPRFFLTWRDEFSQILDIVIVII